MDLLWEKCCDNSSAFNFERIFFIFADNKDNYKSINSLNFIRIPSPIMELAPLGHLKK